MLTCPTVEELDAAHGVYVERESREVFYRAAETLMRLARTRSAKADAVAVLLLTWNARYFRLHPERRHTLLADLGELIHGHAACLNGYRARGIRSLQEYEGANVEALFADFQDTLDPVGTAKTLHLLAPKFFPLWDTKIRHAYGVASKRPERHPRCYWRFMLITRSQVDAVGGQAAVGRNPVKALDEYNYAKFTLRASGL